MIASEGERGMKDSPSQVHQADRMLFAYVNRPLPRPRVKKVVTDRYAPRLGMKALPERPPTAFSD